MVATGGVGEIGIERARVVVVVTRERDTATRDAARARRRRPDARDARRGARGGDGRRARARRRAVRHATRRAVEALAAFERERAGAGSR